MRLIKELTKYTRRKSHLLKQGDMFLHPDLDTIHYVVDIDHTERSLFIESIKKDGVREIDLDPISNEKVLLIGKVLQREEKIINGPHYITSFY